MAKQQFPLTIPNACCRQGGKGLDPGSVWCVWCMIPGMIICRHYRQDLEGSSLFIPVSCMRMNGSVLRVWIGMHVDNSWNSTNMRFRNFDCSTRFRVSSWIDDVGICAHALHVWLIAVVFQYWLTTKSLHSLRHDCTLLRCKDINPWNVLLVKETSLCFWFSCFSVSVSCSCCCCRCCCCCCYAGVVWCLELVMFSCLCCWHVFFATRRVRGEWNLVPSPGWLRLGSGTTRRGTSRDWGWGSWGPLGVDSTWQPVWPMISVLQGLLGRWLLGAPKPPRSS